MGVTTAFLQLFAAELAPKLDGREDLQKAISDVLKQTKGDSKKIPFEIIDDDTTSLLRRVLGLVLWGILFAIPGYWILGKNFMAAIGNFYTVQPKLMLMLLRQIFEMCCRDGRFDEHDITALGQYGLVTAAYACTCAIAQICSPVVRFLLALHTGQTTWTEFTTFWLLVFVVWVFLQFSATPFRHVVRAYAAFRLVDDIAKVPRNFLRQSLMWVLRTFLWYIQLSLNWLLYHYYRLDAKDSPHEWLLRPYVYGELKGPSEIRLLKIPRRFLGKTREFYGMFDPFPGNCELKRCLIDEAEPYECISYTWGSGPRDHDVEIDGHYMQVSEKVYHILCERRSLVKDRWIWIDSICIDQKNLNEKNKQIPMMRDIYSRATRVVVHLGSLADPEKFYSVRALIRNLAVSPGAVASQLRGITTRSMFGNYHNTPEWNAFLEFLSHPFFSRVWVVQEVAVASTLDVIVGDNYIPWALLDEAIQNVSDSGLINVTSRHGRQNRCPRDSAVHFLYMTALRARLSRGDIPRFAEVLSKFHDFDATDARDKIFALMGISDAQEHAHILVDYKTDTISLVCRTARYLIMRGQYFEAIYAAGTGWREQRDGVPSWVPDWTVHPASPKGFRFLDRSERLPFSASGGRSAKLQISSDGKVCTTVGARIGYVAKLSEPLNISDEGIDASTTFTEGVFVIISKWLSDVRSLVEQNFQDAHDGNEGFTRDQMFWATLVGGRDDKGSHVSPEFLVKVRSWESQLGNLTAFQDQLKGIENASTAIECTAGFLEFTAVQQATGNTGISYGGRLAIIDEKFMGLVPPRTRQGDIVCIMSGAETPVLLRRRSGKAKNENSYELVGTCYVQGAMLGEFSQVLEDQEEFELH